MKKILSLSVSGLMLLSASCMAQDVITPAAAPNSGVTKYAAPPSQPVAAAASQGGTIQTNGVVPGATVQQGTVIQQAAPFAQGATTHTRVGGHINSLPPEYQWQYAPGQIHHGTIDINGFQPQQIRYDVYGRPYNPVVVQTPTQIQNVQYDQWGNVIIGTTSQTVHESAFNAGRNQVLPGSLRNVNRWEMDPFGRQVHVTGQEWIGLDGQPHANLNRNTQTNIGGGVIRNDDVQIYRSQAQPPK